MMREVLQRFAVKPPRPPTDLGTQVYEVRSGNANDVVGWTYCCDRCGHAQQYETTAFVFDMMVGLLGAQWDHEVMIGKGWKPGEETLCPECANG